MTPGPAPQSQEQRDSAQGAADAGLCATAEAREQTERGTGTGTRTGTRTRTRLLSKDKGFPEENEPLRRRHVAAELGRQRGREALRPGGNQKFPTSPQSRRIGLVV